MASTERYGKNAPKLKFLGDKWDYKGTKRNDNPDGYLFGQQANLIRRYICNHLNGQKGNLIKLMWVLLSTDEGFGLSQEWILKETGMAKNKYYAARDELIKMNWLGYEEQDNINYLYINYSFLWAQAQLEYER